MWRTTTTVQIVGRENDRMLTGKKIQGQIGRSILQGILLGRDMSVIHGIAIAELFVTT